MSIYRVAHGLCALGLAGVSGCAGPTTPLGAIWDLHPKTPALAPDADDDVDEGRDTLAEGSPARKASRGLASVLSFGGFGGFGGSRSPQIHFDPPRQVLHGPHTLKIVIDDPRGMPDNSGLRIRYHGHDVTRSFLMQAKFSREEMGTRLVAEVPWVRLSPMAEHMIDVDYARPGSDDRVAARLRPPLCRAFAHKDIRGFGEFRPEPALIQSIEQISREMGFNPAFTAALIAQESGFDPRSVSLARAMGLTQVTPIAEEEVVDVFSRWPRYEGSNTYPAPILKWLVMKGEINAQNEWRLNPDRSIRGGLLFAQRLADRWVDSANFSRISWTGGAGSGATGNRAESDVEVARTRLVLASYNSGYARVAQAIGKYGAGWLLAPELKEARRYVNRIISYCDSFEREPSDATARAPAGQPERSSDGAGAGAGAGASSGAAPASGERGAGHFTAFTPHLIHHSEAP